MNGAVPAGSGIWADPGVSFESSRMSGRRGVSARHASNGQNFAFGRRRSRGPCERGCQKGAASLRGAFAGYQNNNVETAEAWLSPCDA